MEVHFSVPLPSAAFYLVARSVADVYHSAFAAFAAFVADADCFGSRLIACVADADHSVAVQALSAFDADLAEVVAPVVPFPAAGWSSLFPDDCCLLVQPYGYSNLSAPDEPVRAVVFPGRD